MIFFISCWEKSAGGGNGTVLLRQRNWTVAWKAVEHGDLGDRTCDPPKPKDVLLKRELMKKNARDGDIKWAKDVFAFNRKP